MTHEASIETGYGPVYGSLAAIEAIQLLMRGPARPSTLSQKSTDCALAELRGSVDALGRALEDERERSLLLEERIQDFEEDYRNTLSGKCAPDEKHCSCVPHLRRRIAELEAPGEVNSIHKLNALVQELRSQIQEIMSERDHLAKELGTRIEAEAPHDS